MTAVLSSNIMTAGSLTEYVNRMAIKNYVPSLYFEQLGQKATKPKGDNTYSWIKVDKMT